MADGISGVSGKNSTGPLNAVYEDEKSKEVSVDDFLNLMIAQLKNQDPMNPMDDTQYVTQLAQFATMQQMQELAYYSRSNFVMSLVGKDVTVARNKIGGDIETFTGPVQKISLVNNEYLIYVDGKAFGLNQIMEIHPPTNNAGGDDEGGKVDGLGLSLTETTPTSAKFVWDRPTTEQDPDAARLRYSVYYSTNPEMDKAADVKKNGKLVGDADQTNIGETKIENLNPGATYYVNVIVKDIHGVEKVYQKQVVVMPKEEVKPK